MVAAATLVLSADLEASDDSQSSIRVRVFVPEPLEVLDGYQLHLGVSGGSAGQLELLAVTIEDRDDFVYRDAVYDEAFNAATGQMLALAENQGVSPKAGAYLATFTYGFSDTADGSFVVDILHDEAAGDQTFLIAGFTHKISIEEVTPAVVTID